MASNQGRQDGNRSGSSHRGFAAMDGDEQRRIAQKGGQASARVQRRDADGQFAGRSGGGSGAGGSSGGSSSRGPSAAGRSSGGQRAQGGSGRAGGSGRSGGSSR